MFDKKLLIAGKSRFKIFVYIYMYQYQFIFHRKCRVTVLSLYLIVRNIFVYKGYFKSNGPNFKYTYMILIK